MNDPKLSYFEKEDILHLAISDEKEFSSVEVSPNITAELNEEGELIGIEILGASLIFTRLNTRIYSSQTVKAIKRSSICRKYTHTSG